ncbi:MAG: Spy/CpxP family protein refolding chaperone [Phycisphaerae bacterium]|nr:Spy/CpxP family protein refolding chaperone [Phycisphaerae bacterium]
MKRLAICLMAIVLAGMWVMAPAAVLADDVVVKTIDPEKPRTPDQPKTPAVTPPAANADSPVKFDSGDRGGDRMFRGLNLTAEQVKQIQPLVEPFAAEMKTSNEAAQKKIADLRANNASRDDIRKAFDESRAASDKLRAQMIAKVSPLLTDEQKTKFKAQATQRDPGGFGGPGGNSPFSVAGMAERAGITLTDDQKKKLADKMAPISKDTTDLFTKMRDLRDRTRKEGGDAEAQKELDALRAKMGEQMQASMKKIDAAVAEVLTPEQKAKYDEFTGKMRADGNRRMLEGVQRRAERAGATDEQKTKIADLVKAAVEAAGKLKADDRDGLDQLRQQLEKDVKALLSDDARKKFEADRGFGGFGGGRGGRGGAGGTGGGTTPLPPL